MRRQKSPFTLRSPKKSSLGQNFDPQYLMPTLSEAPPDWNATSNNFNSFNDKAYSNVLSAENLAINSSANHFKKDMPLQFYLPLEQTKPDIIATSSDLFDDFSEISLPVNFSDAESVYESEQEFDNVDICPVEDPILPVSAFDDEYSFGIQRPFTITDYMIDSRNQTFQPNVYPRPFLTNYRSVSIMLRHLISVDVSPEGAIYVHNVPGQSIAVVSDSGEKAGIIHPNSRVLQEGQNIHIMTHQVRLVKICSRGIIFAANSKSIVYLVDESGAKSTSGKFMDLTKDYSSEVFYGPFVNDFAMRCADSLNLLSNSIYQPQRNGDDIWLVGNVKIKQDQFGNIEISREMNRVLVSVLPTAGEISVRTPNVDMTVGCYSKRYLNVQKGACRVSSGFCGLTAQNGTQKAGLDRHGKVVIF